MNAANVAALRQAPLSGTWFRAVDPRYASSVLSTARTKTISSRFSSATPSVPGFEILYLAENHLVAMFEAQALFGSPLTGVVSHPTKSLLTLAVTVELSNVVDISDPAQASLVSSNAQELTGDWRGYKHRSWAPSSVPRPVGKAPTQEFGEQLYGLCPEVTGFVSLSARLPYHRILVIFPDRLIAGAHHVHYKLTQDGKSEVISIPWSV